MRKELPYFKIDGAYGGNQDWFRDPMMKMGGCAAATLCDTSIYLALHSEKSNLYPFDVEALDKESYIEFSKKMKPYLRPRFRGIDTLDIYIDGAKQYFKDTNEKELTVSGFSGELEVEKAIEKVKTQIDQELPIPYLLLKHKKRSLNFFTWHWFLIVGYEEFDGEMMVKVATYANYHWLSLRELWDTGYREKGGMIIFDRVGENS
ncbi:hypothetical protein [Konateibacter massiliensis]|uniref:hypothetical protein n=1 Tax=Konateibacter massiliensis TaxID=2002841 RepID=UPI000C152239|nr:hypothetical protein [Konateibacter massiliensis]